MKEVNIRVAVALAADGHYMVCEDTHTDPDGGTHIEQARCWMFKSGHQPIDTFWIEATVPLPEADKVRSLSAVVRDQ